MNPDTHRITIPPVRDWSLTAAVAGILASTMGYAGPLVILFQVAESAGLSDTTLVSWIWGMSLASGLMCGWFSLRYKIPLLFAWNAPGSALLVSVIQAFPAAFIAMVAGIALLGALEGSLSAALSQPKEREAALCTFLITASDLSLLGLSSAFWALIIGGVIVVIQRMLAKPSA